MIVQRLVCESEVRKPGWPARERVPQEIKSARDRTNTGFIGMLGHFQRAEGFVKRCENAS